MTSFGNARLLMDELNWPVQQRSLHDLDIGVYFQQVLQIFRRYHNLGRHGGITQDAASDCCKMNFVKVLELLSDCSIR